MRLVIILILCLMAGGPARSQDGAGGRVALILDGSRSMWGAVAGQAKLDLARTALRAVLTDRPGEIGLTAFGSRSGSSCTDIRALVPVTGSGADVIAAAEAMKFQGAAPIAAALRQVVGDLRAAEDAATVVLIADGPDTCRADPCAVAAELEAEGPDLTVHVVGLAVGERSEQLSCIATATGGRYIDAPDGPALEAALREVLEAPAGAAAPVVIEGAVEFAPRAFLIPGVAVADDAPVVWELIPEDGGPARYETGGFEGGVAPGAYRLSAVLGLARGTVAVEVGAEPARPEVILDAARLVIRPRPELRSDVASDAMVEATLEDGHSVSGQGETVFHLPAGPVTVRATLEGASVREDLVLVAGETLERDVMITTGIAAIEIFYAEEQRVETGSPQVRILAEGTEVAFAQGAEPVFVLAPGAYVAAVTMGLAEVSVPFAVSGGREAAVAVRLDAGLLTTEIPGATEITLRRGDHVLDTILADRAQWVAPGGTYRIEARRDGAVLRQDALVAPGARTDVILP